MKQTTIRGLLLRGLLFDREDGRDVSSKYRLTFTGLHDDISQKTEDLHSSIMTPVVPIKI
jgi:hypothetical protein